MGTRSPVIPVGEWWLAEARRMLTDDPRGDDELAEILGRHIGRPRAFHRTMLSRFKNGKVGATLDLCNALIREFVDLSCPVLFPESNEEALALMHTASRYRGGRGVAITPDAPPAPIVQLPKPKKTGSGVRRAPAGATPATAHSRK